MNIARRAEASYCTVGFRDQSLDAALESIASAGFTCIELDCDPHALGPPKGSQARDILATLDSFCLKTPTIHAPLGRHTLGAPAEPWRAEMVTLLADYLRFASDLGAEGMVIHPVPNPMFLPDRQIQSWIEPMLSAARRSLDELVVVAEKTKQRILLENLPYTSSDVESYPLISMRQLRPWIEDYPEAHVGLVIDTGHAWTAGFDPAAEIITAGDRLCATHLQDVDAEHPNDNHWLPTHGGLDWQAIRSALHQVHYRGPWTFEATNGRYGETPLKLAQLARAVANKWGL